MSENSICRVCGREGGGQVEGKKKTEEERRKEGKGLFLLTEVKRRWKRQ